MPSPILPGGPRRQGVLSRLLQFGPVDRGRAEVFLDAQQLVVLGDAVGAAAQPVLIWPALVATAMSAMVVSSVSPLRWLMIGVNLFRFASSMASSVSVSVPIWFTLTRMLLPQPSSMPVFRRFGVGDEQVVADELDLAAEFRGQLLPAGPVVLGQAVLDRADRATWRTAPPTGRSSRRSR